MNTKKTILFTLGSLAVREKREGEESNEMVIEGEAIVFNQPAVLFDGKYYKEIEIVSPTAITSDFLLKQDVKLNLLHERRDTLARCKQGKGTLTLELKPDGLYFVVRLPDCDLGHRCYELVKNGTYTGCSYEFYSEQYTEKVETLADGREQTTIVHEKFASLNALTIAMDPVYETTTVSLRELQEREAAHKPEPTEQEKREKELKEQRELQERRDREAREREAYMDGLLSEMAQA